jgi:hypothetical protein
MKSCGLPHTPLLESFFFGSFSYIHDHHIGGKLQAYDLFKMAHLELAHHLLFLPYVDVLKIHMIAHYIFFFKTYLTLNLLNFVVLSIFKPTHG